MAPLTEIANKTTNRQTKQDVGKEVAKRTGVCDPEGKVPKSCSPSLDLWLWLLVLDVFC